MKLKEYTKEDLELMSYDDIAVLVLKESKKKMKINDLFKKICEVLELTEDDFVNQIADFFEILTTNRKFVMLEDGYWDLRTRHSEKIVVEDDEEDFEEIIEEPSEDDKDDDEDSDGTFFDEDSDDDTGEDDLKDLVVIDEEEEI